jgi:Spy/CpxP family protein refolding chaperone
MGVPLLNPASNLAYATEEAGVQSPANVEDSQEAQFDVDEWACPRCGAACRGPRGRHRGRFATGSGPHGKHGQKGWGRHHGPRGPRGPGLAAERFLRHASDLKLSDDQIEKLESLAYDAKTKLIDLHAEMEKGHLAMRQMLQSDSDDLTTMKRRLNDMAKKHTDIQELKLTNLIASKKVLTDEQKKMIKKQFPRMGRVLD